MKRACQHRLNACLEAFPCVALIGVRQCGKTTLLGTMPAEWRRFDLERRADHQVVSRDPDTFFRLYPRRVAIDEAQLVPAIFPALRVAIDAHRRERGRFVITGSSSPAMLRSVAESLAGRVAVVEMAPFSWEEATETVGQDSFVSRLKDPKAKPADLVEGLRPRGDLRQLHDYWWRGGYPEPWIRAEATFAAEWCEQYIQTYLFRDVKRLFPGLDEVRFRRFLELLGGFSGRILNYAEVARALNVSQPTAHDYFDIAEGTFLWRKIPAFAKDVVKRTVKHPRGYLRDTGLLHALLRIPSADALLSHPQLGASWEGMVVEEIVRQLQARGMAHQASYYRTGAGAEVDLVVEAAFGSVAFEIKHSSTVNSGQLRGLRDFVSGRQARLGVVISNDTSPRLLEENLLSVPMTHL